MIIEATAMEGKVLMHMQAREISTMPTLTRDMIWNKFQFQPILFWRRKKAQPVFSFVWPSLQFLLVASQIDPRVLFGMAQKLLLQNNLPGLSNPCYMSQHSWCHPCNQCVRCKRNLTSSSSATSLFFATSPIMASRLDRNLSWHKQWEAESHKAQHSMFNFASFMKSFSFHNRINLLVAFCGMMFDLAAEFHETFIYSPELEVVCIVQWANLGKLASFPTTSIF